MAGFLYPVLLLAGSFILEIIQAQPSEKFPHYLPLAPDNKFDLYWKFDEETITFEIHVKTFGYGALGISRTGGMEGADIALGWVKDGKAYLQNRYANQRVLPKLTTQTWILLSGRETNTHTVLKFYRRLDHCSEEKVPITKDTVKLIWSYNPSMEPDSPNGDPSYHGRDHRGTKSVQLLSPNMDIPDLPPDTITVDLLNKKVTIPESKTTWWCQGFSIPKELLSKKHHVLRVSPVIQNKAFVHHITMYGCRHQLSGGWDRYDQQGAPCNSGVLPFNDCHDVLFGWAVGAGDFIYPKDVGFPLGGPGKEVLFLKMEIHYDNPLQENGVVDSSGLRLYASPSTRKFDVATFYTAIVVNDTHIIPPQAQAFKSMGYCPNECFRKVLGAAGKDITVIATFLHTHLVGAAVRVRHFRNGKELPFLDADENYDFNFQEHRLKEEPVLIKATDELVVECQYDTSKRTSITKGGPGTTEEMCFAFFLYYPRVDLARCASLPTLGQTMTGLSERVDFVETSSPPYYQISYPPKYVGRDVDYMWDSQPWQDENQQKRFQTAVYSGAHTVQCKGSTTYYINSENMVIPNYIKPVEWKDQCFNTGVTGLNSGSINIVRPTYVVNITCITGLIILLFTPKK